MKVLHATESRGWSGGVVQLWGLCGHLLGNGHQAALFSPPDGELMKRVPGSGVEGFPCPLRQDYDIGAARRLAAAVRAFRPDIVHAHHPRAHAVALLAGYFEPIPRLVVSRRVSFPLPKWNPFSRWKYRTSRVRMYTAVSEDIRRVLVEGGVAPERVVTIHSGVDTEKFSPRPPDEKTREALGLPSDRPVIGNLNHFSWWKGQGLFLEAARTFISAGGKAHFLLVGKDTDGEEARRRVKSLGLEDHVTSAGFRRDMPEILSLLGVVAVCPLAGEGFSGVLREAMAMGVPAAATDVGGNRELVFDGKTGLLVPPGDADALARAFQKFLSDGSFASSCARSARNFVVDNFSLLKTAEKTLSLYRKITP